MTSGKDILVECDADNISLPLDMAEGMHDMLEFLKYNQL